MTSAARFNWVVGILFWHESAKIAVIPNFMVSLMGFLELFLFLVAGMTLEAWDLGSFFCYYKVFRRDVFSFS